MGTGAGGASAKGAVVGIAAGASAAGGTGAILAAGAGGAAETGAGAARGGSGTGTVTTGMAGRTDAPAPCNRGEMTTLGGRTFVMAVSMRGATVFPESRPASGDDAGVEGAACPTGAAELPRSSTFGPSAPFFRETMSWRKGFAGVKAGAAVPSEGFGKSAAATEPASLSSAGTSVSSGGCTFAADSRLESCPLVRGGAGTNAAAVSFSQAEKTSLGAREDSSRAAGSGAEGLGDSGERERSGAAS